MLTSFLRPREYWNWKEIVWNIFCSTFVRLLRTKSMLPPRFIYSFYFLSKSFAMLYLLMWNIIPLSWIFLFVPSHIFKVDGWTPCRYQNADWRLRPLPDEMLRCCCVLNLTQSMILLSFCPPFISSFSFKSKSDIWSPWINIPK